MAIKPCKECKQEVSTSAKACPHCGKSFPTGGLTLPAKVFLGIFGLMVIGSFASESDPASSGAGTVSQAGSAASQPPSPEATVTAADLFAQYQTNEVAADNFYKGRWLAVSGRIDGISKDFADDVYLTLRTSNAFMSVHAELHSSAVGHAASLSPGQRVQLLCKGKGMILGSPMLDDCRFQ